MFSRHCHTFSITLLLGRNVHQKTLLIGCRNISIMDENRTGPAAKLWLGLVAFVLVLGICTFFPAGTLDYWQGWVLLSVYLGSSLAVLQYLLRYDPALMERRMRSGPAAQQEKNQNGPVLFITLGFFALFVVSSVDFRYPWSDVPLFLVILGDVLVTTGWFVVYLVFRENSFASSAIEVSGEQRIITTGPYAVVRHPMYAGAILWSVGIPPGLGSFWGLAVLVCIIPSFLFRIVQEERYLSGHLPGYPEYIRNVPWRLVPGFF
jgi:protein-S-isoprenylcysteine O-methyltransferase Ste14